MANTKPLKGKTSPLKSELWALALAAKDPRTPLSAKALAVLAVLYALFPFDVIPEFIPFLGFLDDLIILPLGLYLAINAIPKEVRQEAETKAGVAVGSIKKAIWIIVAFVVTIWLAAILLIVWLISRLISG